MTLSLGNEYQKKMYSDLANHLEQASLDNYLDEHMYQKMRAALDRLAKENITADNKLLMDIAIIKAGFKSYKPAYASKWAFDALFTGALRGAFVLCLTVALLPTAPLWLYFTIPSVSALMDYVFFNHLWAADIGRGHFKAFERAYLREQVALQLVNHDAYLSEPLAYLADTPYEDTIKPALLELKRHLLCLYRRQGITLEGAIGIHEKINQMIQALVSDKGEEAFDKLNDIERLLLDSTPSSFPLTGITFFVGAMVGVVVLTLSLISAGTFPAFCAAALAVTLVTTKCAFIGFLVDLFNNYSEKNTTNRTFNAFSSKVKTFFSGLREQEGQTETTFSQKAPLSTELSSCATDIANSPYLQLATTT